MGFATRVVRMALQDVISLSVFWVSYFLTLASLSAYELDSGTAPLSRYDCFRCFVPMYIKDIKDFWLHKCPLLSRIARNPYINYVVCCQ